MSRGEEVGVGYAANTASRESVLTGFRIGHVFPVKSSQVETFLFKVDWMVFCWGKHMKECERLR